MLGLGVLAGLQAEFSGGSYLEGMSAAQRSMDISSLYGIARPRSGPYAPRSESRYSEDLSAKELLQKETNEWLKDVEI